jgi:two-component system chemotaxis sensor kinase CheA
VPLTLAIIEGFQVRIDKEIYIIPIEAVVETLAFDERESTSDNGRGVMSLRGRTLPYVRLRELLEQEGTSPSRESIVVVRSEGAEAGIVVDALLGQAQTVIKPLGKLLQGLRGISGSAILGSGDVAFILDVHALLRQEVEREDVREKKC